MIAADEGHVPPLVMVSQEGGEYSEFPDLPPARGAVRVRERGGRGGRGGRGRDRPGPLGFNAVLAPVVDVGTADGTGALDARAFSDDPARSPTTPRRGSSVRRGGRAGGAQALPGARGRRQAPEDGPTPVGLTVAELRERDLVPFRAAFDAGAPAVLVGHGSYTTDDFVTPASLSKTIATDILRDELGFGGVSITDDLARRPSRRSRRSPTRRSMRSRRASTSSGSPARAAIRRPR